MKLKPFNSITKNGWLLTPIALAFVLLALPVAPSGTAQSKKQKRVISVRLGSANEGSRVTVVSDSVLNDYEAYRRGDRFYVKIPAADFTSGVPNLRGAGFEDVKVEKAADGSIISFRLQPGTAARVDQRSNRLDVVFSTLGRSESSGETTPNVTGRGQNTSGNRSEVAGASPPPSTVSSPAGPDSSSSNPNRIERQSQSTFAPQQTIVGSQQGSSGTASQAHPAASPRINETATGSPPAATSTTGSSSAAISAGQPTTVEPQPAPTVQGTDSAQNLPVRRGSASQWVTRNWLLAVISALVFVGLPLLYVVYRRSRPKRDSRPTHAKESLRQPKNSGKVEFSEPEFAAGVDSAVSHIAAVETTELSESKVEPFPLVPPSSETSRTQKMVEPQSTKSVLHSLEAKPLIVEKSSSNTAVPPQRTDSEVKELLTGEDDVAEEEMRLRLEKEARQLADEEVRRRDDEQRLLAEAEERQRIAEERLKLEQEALMQAAVELTLRRAEVEAARRVAEEESRLLAENQEKMRMEDERRRLVEEERLRLEAEAQRRAQEERKRVEEFARLQAEEEERRLAELDVVREQAQQRAEQEQRIRAEIEVLRRAEVEQNKRLEAEKRRRAEAEARLQEEESRRQTAAAARVEVEAEACRIVEDQQAPWFDVPMDRQEGEETPPTDKSISGSAASEETVAPSRQFQEPVEEIAAARLEKGLAILGDDSSIPSEIFKRLNSNESHERAAALAELAPLGVHDVFSVVSRAFDDESTDVRNAAALALYDMQLDRAASFTRALREGSPERRRRIGAALAASGLAKNAINNLTGESREKTYDAFSLLFLMAKAGEVQPLMQAIEEHANVEVRLAVVKLLALSGQADIVPAFRRLAVRGSLPSEVRSAVMEAIYQIGSQARESAHSVGGAART